MSCMTAAFTLGRKPQCSYERHMNQYQRCTWWKPDVVMLDINSKGNNGETWEEKTDGANGLFSFLADFCTKGANQLRAW